MSYCTSRACQLLAAYHEGNKLLHTNLVAAIACRCLSFLLRWHSAHQLEVSFWCFLISLKTELEGKDWQSFRYSKILVDESESLLSAIIELHQKCAKQISTSFIDKWNKFIQLEHERGIKVQCMHEQPLAMADKKFRDLDNGSLI